MKKKIYISIFALFLNVIILGVPSFVIAGTIEYRPLAPVPALGINNSMTLGGEDGLTTYLNSWVIILIRLATALAVLYVVYGGIKYTLTDSFSSKADAKATIMRALGGLLLALTSYMILNTINPGLLTGKIRSLQDVSVGTISGGPKGAQSSIVPITGGSPGSPTGTPISTGPNQSGLGSGKVSIPTNGFPNDAWNAWALQQVQESGLSKLTPADAARYFPNGQVTDQGWVNLLSGIAKPESSYDPTTVFYEKSMGKNSVGLLQLSADDLEVARAGFSEKDLKDPYNNIKMGIQIMERQVRQDGVISGKDSKGRYTGGAEYWSTLQDQ